MVFRSNGARLRSSQALKHLVEMAADREDQVATVFYLIARVLIAKAAALLLVEVEREAHAGVDPTLADLAQSPYSPGLWTSRIIGVLYSG